MIVSRTKRASTSIHVLRPPEYSAQWLSFQAESMQYSTNNRRSKFRCFNTALIYR
jgi:hypothetical protein